MRKAITQARKNDHHGKQGVNDFTLSRRRLLESYQKRVSELSIEQEDLLRQLENYARCYEDEHKLKWEVRQRDDEVAQLQQALKDMQSFLLKEREQVLRLHSSNDKLKLRTHEDSKKIEHLVQLCGLPQEDARHFVNPSMSLPTTIVVRRETDPSSHSRRSVSQTEHDARLREKDALSLQVQSLEAQISEQSKLAQEHKRAIEEDDRIRNEELKTLSERNASKRKVLAEKTKNTQEIMYSRTQDFLDKRFQFREHEKEWMAEKDHLLKEVSSILSYQRKSDETKGRKYQEPFLLPSWNAVTNECVRRSEEDYKQAIRDLEWQVEQQDKLTDTYREQIVQMETEIEKFQSVGDVSKKQYESRTEKMSARLNLMNKRYQELEQRRDLEVEGFQNDLRSLRQKLRRLESQLYKLTAGLIDPLEKMGNGDEMELAILERVRRSAAESKRLTSDMRLLKELMFGLEDELHELS